MKSIAKHTPGPWTAVINHTNSGSIAAVVNSEGYSIVHGINGMTTVDTPENVECEANARLIAAAPELLDALKHVVAYMEHQKPKYCGIDDDRGVSPYQDAIEAITKAEGNTK